MTWFTAQVADCQLPVALLSGPYIPTVDFSQNNLEKWWKCLSGRFISLKEVQKKTLMFLWFDVLSDKQEG